MEWLPLLFSVYFWLNGWEKRTAIRGTRKQNINLLRKRTTVGIGRPQNSTLWLQQRTLVVPGSCVFLPRHHWTRPGPVPGPDLVRAKSSIAPNAHTNAHTLERPDALPDRRLARVCGPRPFRRGTRQSVRKARRHRGSPLMQTLRRKSAPRSQAPRPPPARSRSCSPRRVRYATSPTSPTASGSTSAQTAHSRRRRAHSMLARLGIAAARIAFRQHPPWPETTAAFVSRALLVSACLRTQPTV